MRKLMLSALLACALGTSAAAQTPGPAQKTDAWILHVTDPHLFVDALSDKDRQDAQKDPAKKRKTDKIDRQRRLNADALKDLLSRANTFVGAEGEPRLVLLTGDFDVDPCWSAVPPEQKDENSPDVAKKCLTDVDKAQRDNQVKQLTELFAASSVPDVYLLPGNNDIARELADDASLTYFGALIDEVRKALAEKKSGVRLHNLAGCYAGAADSECYADIAGTPYRLVALPSHSFKNATKSVFDANAPLQEKQMEKFASLMAQARTNGKRVLVAAHVPDIDDPFFMAQDVYAAQQRQRPDAKVPNRSPWSTWNVTQPVIDAWTKAVESDDVAGVLAGHLHDSHKEIYSQPYSWSTPDAARSANRKLFLAPPLAVQLQDSSPIQARGFSLVHLLGDHVERRLYWYDAAARSFSADMRLWPTAPDKRWFSSGRIRHAVRWLWNLGAPETALMRMAILLIAFLAAYLTVMTIWQIPPAENPLAASSSSAGADKKSESQPPAQKPAFEPSPFANNLGKTVIAGLGGLAAETVLKSLDGKAPSAGDKEFYIIWFVLFFFVLLFGLAFFRGVAEAFRTRLAIIYYTLERGSARRDAFWFDKFRMWASYWIHRLARWIFSLRVPLLTLFDTFINLIQGRNQTMTRALADTIIEQQRNVVRVANTIRQQLDQAIELRLLKVKLGQPSNAQPAPGSTLELNPVDVRVNISVLSADQSSVFYIAREPGSAIKEFNKRSVAWVSVFTGRIRWYKNGYKAEPWFKDVVLFDNRDHTIAGDEDQVLLASHYQPRDQDYEAFVMFPFPWPQRGFGTDYVKGAIHISFRHQSDFERLWKIDPDPIPAAKEYRDHQKMLEDWCDPELRAELKQKLIVLGELLRGFNENVYRNFPPS